MLESLLLVVVRELILLLLLLSSSLLILLLLAVEIEGETGTEGEGDVDELFRV